MTRMETVYLAIPLVPLLASIITGSVLASQDDEAYVNVYPTE